VRATTRIPAFLILACSLALAAPIAGRTGSDARPVVPPGALLAADAHHRLVVLDRSGHVLRRVPGTFGNGASGIELAPDRRHAFVALYPTRSLDEVDLATGAERRIASGGSPALDPDGTRLAFVSLAKRGDIIYRTAVVVLNLTTGRRRTIPFGRETVWGTPPEVLLNWSPDGRRLAAFDGKQIRLVDVSTAQDVASQPAPLGEQPSRTRSPLLAPVFLDDRTLVALANCCIGRQNLVAVDLQSGRRSPFATLPEPPESLRRIGPASFVATTPDGYLLLFSHGNVKRIATGFYAVSG
jgi:hypothetical protein